MTSMLKKLSHQGYKITPQRRIILQILSESDKCLSADELVERIRSIEPNVSQATVYRNLNLLVDQEIVTKILVADTPARYTIFRGHRHFMVCLSCGAALSMNTCPLTKELRSFIEQEGFEITGHHFQVLGYCENCRAGKNNDFSSHS